MTAQFIRKVSLTLVNSAGALDLSAFHFKFHVLRGNITTANSVDIRVYNLSNDTMNLIEKEFRRVILQAGYEGNFGTIFIGTVKQIRRGKESSVDSYLDITAADGDIACHFAVVQKSIAAGSSAKDHFQALLNASGLSAGETATLPAAKLPRGKVLFGSVNDHMRKLASTTGNDWSVQNEKLTLVPKSAYLPGEIPVITAATGMIGFPEQQFEGIKVKCLLNPNIKAAGRIKIDNKSVQEMPLDLSMSQSAVATGTWRPTLANDGIYKVLYVEHEGDTRGQNFYTTVVCLGANGIVSQDQLSRQSAFSELN